MLYDCIIFTCALDCAYLFLFTLSVIQFHRSFPGPPDVTPAEVEALAQRYYDPNTGLYNYLQFHNDLSAIGAEGTEVSSAPTRLASLSVRTHVP